QALLVLCPELALPRSPGHRARCSGTKKIDDVSRFGTGFRIISSPHFTRGMRAMTEATIFATALEKSDVVERSAYLDEACGGDAALRRRIEELLQAHGQAGEFLERPAIEQITADEALDFLQPSEQSDSLGRFADYEVLEVLGRSAFGAVVLKAFDAKLHRMVAI